MYGILGIWKYPNAKTKEARRTAALARAQKAGCDCVNSAARRARDARPAAAVCCSARPSSLSALMSSGSSCCLE